MNERITDDMVRSAAEAIIHAKMPDGDAAYDYLPTLDDEERAVWGISTPTFRYDRFREMRDDQLHIFATILAKAALTAALQHQASLPVEAWQTIETAPKDGTHVLLFTQWGGDEIATDPFDEIQIGYWDAGNLTGGIWHREPGWSCERIGEATYWRHLPAAPSTGGR